MPKKLSLAEQVQKLQNDRIYLRSTIQTMLGIAKSVPSALLPAVQEQLQKALDYTANEEEKNG